MPSEIGEAQRQETRGQTRDPRAHDDREDAEQRAVGKVGRQRGRERSDAVGLRDSVGGRGGSVRHGSLDRLPYGFVRTVTTADNPDRNRGAQRRVVERDLDRHALDDFREIAGRIVRWQERELRSAGGRDLEHAAVDHFAGIHIDADVDRIADFDVRQLRFAEVRLDPRGPADEGQDLRAGRHQLSRADLPLADGAVGRRDDARVAQVDLRDGERRFLGVEIGDELQLLRLDHGLAAALGFDGQLVAPQQRPRLREVRVSTGELRGEPLLIGDRRLHALPRRRIGRQQRLLARTFRAGAVDVGLHGLRAGFRGSDLGVGLIDAGERALNPRVLELALTAIVFERRLRRLDRSEQPARPARDSRRLPAAPARLLYERAGNQFTFTSRTSPATFVLSGVRSRLTNASFVT